MSLFFLDLDKDFEERFDISRFMEKTDNADPLTSSFLKDITNLRVSGKFKVTSEESRPDLLSDRIYGDVQYWWVILFFNGISDVDELKEESEINYPSLDDLEDLFLSLKSKESSQVTV